ncbi:MAG: hypothetical protein RSD95_02820 [Clostridia bacterium]
MRTVVITQGTYGYKPKGARHISPRDSSSGQIELPDNEAARIVGLGVAEYTGVDAVATTADGDFAITQGNPIGEAPEGNEAPAMRQARLDGQSLMDMTKDEIARMAKEMDVDIRGVKNKAEIVRRIVEETVLVSADEECPPEIRPEEPEL